MSDISTIFVPPDGEDYKGNILIIGEAPGEEEEKQRKPFVGKSGELLFEVLARHGKYRADFKIMNLCGYRPKLNNFSLLEGSIQLKQGLKAIDDYITKLAPTCILALGAKPLYYLCNRYGIHNNRGSILSYKGIKVIPTFHPSYISRYGQEYAIFDADIKKFVEELKFPELNHDEFIIHKDPSAIDIEDWRIEIQKHKIITIDIESIKGTSKILCVGFGVSGVESYVIPYSTFSHHAIKEICENPNIEKVFHGGGFDCILLGLNDIRVANYCHDTMVAFHVMEIELPKTLDFLTSLYTRTPYYKGGGRAEIPEDEKGWSERVDKDELWIYNGNDDCATFLVHKKLEREMTEDERYLYKQEIEMGHLAITISNNGLPVDEERVELLLSNQLNVWSERQKLLDIGCNSNDVNVNSPKQMPALLYDKLQLPTRTNDGKVTTDEDAIVSLIGYCKTELEKAKRETTKNTWQYKLTILKLILEIRGIRKTISTYLRPRLSYDGRLRSYYKASATNTGRWACQKFLDGTGIQAQTFPRESVEVTETKVEVEELWRKLQGQEVVND